ncbi:MAG: helix-turn-helix domain-containing protein [Nocardiopsaceae bacterium]|nr:helix-turn-helix domain-containing protein [Nocardiopsaceae bacterium]
MPTVDEIVAGLPFSGLSRVSAGGGNRKVIAVRLAERFAELDDAPADSFVVLTRLASAEIDAYRLDMALRWAWIHRVAAVAAFSAERWKPAITALDIAGRADIALVSIPADAELAALVRMISGEIGGGAERALGRAQQGLDAVLRAGPAGASPDELAAAVGTALGIPVAFRPAGHGGEGAPDGEGARDGGGGRRGGARGDDGHGAPAPELSVPVLVDDAPSGHFVTAEAVGELRAAADLVLHAAAAAAARSEDMARRARDLPARSRSELLAELLMSESAVDSEFLERARQACVPLSGWHLAVRIEADNLDEVTDDEVRRFELLEAAGQSAIQAVSAPGETWYLSRVGRAIILIRATRSNPGPQAGARVVRSAERALAAIGDRQPALRLRAGVGAGHEGPTGLRASAAEARNALTAARAARRPAGVAVHDVVGIRRMLMEWYASDAVRASVSDQLAPLEKLGPERAETAIRTLAAYLDEQGSVVRTAQRLHLHRNAVTNRLRGIIELLDVDLDDPDQRLVLQLACRARLLG